jgi:hypothetical protein
MYATARRKQEASTNSGRRHRTCSVIGSYTDSIASFSTDLQFASAGKRQTPAIHAIPPAIGAYADTAHGEVFGCAGIIVLHPAQPPRWVLI